MDGTEVNALVSDIETSRPKKKPLVPPLRRIPLDIVERDIQECVEFFNGGSPADPETGMNVIRKVLMKARIETMRKTRKA
jgi:hypothetical protein